MTVGQNDRPSLDGALYTVPFLQESIGARGATLYRELVEQHGQQDVLVIKRFPTALNDITETFGDATDGVERPRVRGLSAHARETIEALPSPPRILSPSEQGVLLDQYLAAYDWDQPYLEQAAAQESFDSDVGRFVAEATWQGGEIDTDDPALAELASVNGGFHDWLEDNGLLDPSAVLSRAERALDVAERLDRIQRSFEAVLVLEFEEFTPVDRAYLARLTEGVELVCLAERDSAIQRVWNEPRRIEDRVPGLTRQDELPDDAATEPSETISEPSAVASVLATGDPPDRAGGGECVVIDEETFSEQVRAVAEEIERLHRVEGVPYDECAVVLRDSNAPIPDALRVLRTAGIPTASATVGGLEHDPAARELYALVCWCAEPVKVEWSRERARSVLDARYGCADETLEAVRERLGEDGLEPALQQWLLETDLKHRIAASESELDAKSQFRHVRDVLQLARFIGDSPLVDASWELFAEALEREFTHATSDKIATELDVPTGGVVVDAARVLKNVSREAVFLLDVVDREYPADPQFNSLFPTPRLEQLPGYPAFTAPTAADVRETFSTVREGDDRRPLKAYYAELSRRMLAVGARVASDRLYIGTYEQTEGGTGSRLQPSRFLAPVEAAVGELDRRDDDEIHTHGESVAYALSQVDDALEGIRLAGLSDDPVDLDAVERRFGVVQTLLEHDPADDLRRAIEARADFAAGVVRRE
jgi:hypothetical protein